MYYHGSRTGEGSVNVSTLFLRPKKEKFPTNNKSEEFKSISSLSKILDGRSKTNERLNKTRKRNDKTRPERCIFQYSSPPSLKKICKIFMLKKSLRIPIQLLRRMKIKKIIYLDDILDPGQTLDMILKARDTVIYIIQSFIINKKRSVITPSSTIEIIGTMINFTTTELSLSLEKLQSIINLCHRIL